MNNKIEKMRSGFFNDKKGKLILAQKPNLPLTIWLLATIIHIYIDSGRIGNFFDVLAFGSIFTWAWMELFSGDTYFRRVLGFMVLAVTIKSRI